MRYTYQNRDTMPEGRYAMRCEYDGILRDDNGKIITVSREVAYSMIGMYLSAVHLPRPVPVP